MTEQLFPISKDQLVEILQPKSKSYAQLFEKKDYLRSISDYLSAKELLRLKSFLTAVNQQIDEILIERIKKTDCFPSLIVAMNNYHFLSHKDQCKTLCATIEYNDQLALPLLRTEENNTIDLSDLGLTAVTPKIISRLQAINQITPISSINLSGNDLIILPKTIFHNFNNLETLNLDFNRLESLPEGILEDTTRLKILILSRNNIFVLTKTIFHHLKNLEELSLENNPFQALPEDQFQDLTTGLNDCIKAVIGNAIPIITVPVPAVSTSADASRSMAASSDFNIGKNNSLRIEQESQKHDGLSSTAMTPARTNQEFFTAARTVVTSGNTMTTRASNQPTKVMTVQFNLQNRAIQSNAISSTTIIPADNLNSSSSSSGPITRSQKRPGSDEGGPSMTGSKKPRN